MADEAAYFGDPGMSPDAPWLHNYEKETLRDYVDRTASDFDAVDRPAHYNQGEYEVIDIIRDKLTDEQFKGYCLGNLLKYVLRHEYKGKPEQDLRKASWYLNKLLEEIYD